MVCSNPLCYNSNPEALEFCDKCMQVEFDKMTYDELVEMYIEGKEWLEHIKAYPEDGISESMVEQFRIGWFAILNVELQNRAKKKLD